MKKLEKLSINPEKLMKNDELINLRGGYGGTSGTCAAVCQMPDGGFECNISMAEAEQYARECNQSAGGMGNWCCDSCGNADWYKSYCLDQ